MATEVYLVIGTDQDGDACWDILRDLASAQKQKSDMDETCYQPCAIHRIDLTANEGDTFKSEKVA